MHATPIFALVGPTAVGKTAVSLELAQRVGGEIVNADALLVYRGFDVGTAKPSLAEREAVPHHLIDILEPDERFSAGEFARRARAVITEIQARGRVPIVVGGSGFYQRALFRGLDPVPPGDEQVREALRARVEREGLPALVAELQSLDPASAARIPAGDTQRILRALEVVQVTGVPLTTWFDRARGTSFDLESEISPGLQAPNDQCLSAIRFGLTLPRAILYDRIQSRVAQMVERGWVDEVRTLLGSGLSPFAPAFQAIGYRQLVRHVQGAWPLDQALTDIVIATRQFAKRQMTWFRKEIDVTWFDSRDAEPALTAMSAFVYVSDGGVHA